MKIGICLGNIVIGIVLASILIICPSGAAAPGEYFAITVTDEATGRGVPLVELRTVNETRFLTDSAGIAAINDPDLMGQKVYFHISSPGYEYPADGFGNRGQALQLTPGGSAVIKLKRLNIAERLYRLTGSGIYRDSILVGQPVPLAHPLLDGQVMGQDTVEVTPYQGSCTGSSGTRSGPLIRSASSPHPGPRPSRRGRGD